jgi:hypothetical protein
MRSSELAASIDWQRSRLSHHLSRMERRGLIRREDCATDNRGAEVLLTQDGAQLFRGATAPHMRAIKKRFADALMGAASGNRSRAERWYRSGTHRSTERLVRRRTASPRFTSKTGDLVPVEPPYLGRATNKRLQVRVVPGALVHPFGYADSDAAFLAARSTPEPLVRKKSVAIRAESIASASSSS